MTREEAFNVNPGDYVYVDLGDTVKGTLEEGRILTATKEALTISWRSNRTHPEWLSLENRPRLHQIQTAAAPAAKGPPANNLDRDGDEYV